MTSWRRKRSAANQSRGFVSLLTGKITANFIASDLLLCSRPTACADSTGISDPNSLSNRTGNSSADQGSIGGRSGSEEPRTGEPENGWSSYRGDGAVERSISLTHIVVQP